MENQDTQYSPDKIKHPGERLEWLLDQRDIKKVDFAKRCGRPTKTISEIISGKTMITPETALQFERVFGDINADFWLSLETKYQLEKAKTKEQQEVISQNSIEWANNFPFKEMHKKGFLKSLPNKDNLVETLLKYFGVSSSEVWENYWSERMNLARFKQQNNNHSFSYFAIAAWLRQGEILASEVDTKEYEANRFREVLMNIRSLTQKPWKDIEEELKQTCSDVGVAVVLVPSLCKTGLRGAACWEPSGSAFWGNKDKAVIILSDYSKSEERVWFTFFHEAAHILFHSKKTIFIDEKTAGSADDEIEKEANEFSAEHIVPAQKLSEFRKKYDSTRTAITVGNIKKFSDEIGISAGLLIERLQHEEIVSYKFRAGNLKRKLEFKI